MLGTTVVQKPGVVRAHGYLEVTAPSTRDLYFQILEIKVQDSSFRRVIVMYVMSPWYNFLSLFYDLRHQAALRTRQSIAFGSNESKRAPTDPGAPKSQLSDFW
ncbi:MAG: hypothetical protein Q9215_007013 [Flavoplaca cf. flavocitrina]